MAKIIEFLPKYSSASGGIVRHKHAALTKFVRRNWLHKTASLKTVLDDCDVSAFVGALPSGLRNRLQPGADVADATCKFHNILKEFLDANISSIFLNQCSRCFWLPKMYNLFGTECVLHARPDDIPGARPWRGSCGTVLKVSFPKIDADYALKVFFDWAEFFEGHGPWFEVATAFAANHAEPAVNCPVHMASLRGNMYMLSDWGGDCRDNIPVKQKKYKIFETEEQECRLCNMRHGRMIDWGCTRPTDYGMEKYPVRKIYRTMLYAAEHNDDALMRWVCLSNLVNAPKRKSLNAAIDLLFVDMFCSDSDIFEHAINMSQQYVH